MWCGLVRFCKGPGAICIAVIEREGLYLVGGLEGKVVICGMGFESDLVDEITCQHSFQIAVDGISGGADDIAGWRGLGMSTQGNAEDGHGG